MSLFTPIKIGRSQLQHRVVMAPLTRFRGDEHAVPMLPLMEDYYVQRASIPGTLLITEGTLISPRAGVMPDLPNVPGIWNEDQIKAWKQITDKVHEKGSFMYMQLWTLGRAGHAEGLEKRGYRFVSSSAVPMDDKSSTPVEATEEEIQAFIGEFAQAAKNAIAAGFDGVEVHGANGYLVDQFTQDVANKRTDKWGGSIENRARFAIEVTKAIAEAVGHDRVGFRISPWSRFQGMRMADPIPQFTYLVEKLKELGVAYIHAVESRISGNADVDVTDDNEFVYKTVGKAFPVLVAGGFQPASGQEVVDNHKDNDVAVVFGRHFIANPDLPFKIKNNIELTPYNRDTFYTPASPKGYTDYPFSKEFNGTL